MDDCATTRLRFDTQTALALEAAFDGGRITSDGGLLWLSKMDSELGLCEAMELHGPLANRGLRQQISINQPYGRSGD